MKEPKPGPETTEHYYFLEVLKGNYNPFIPVELIESILSIKYEYTKEEIERIKSE